MGDPVPPFPRETVMRMAHDAVMPMTWERGRPARIAAPRARRRPPPDPPPPGAGTRRLPPAGGGWEGGCTRRTMVTSAVHAVAPHNAAMHIRLFLGGLRPPKPSRGWGHGETGFPHAPLREPMFTLGMVQTHVTVCLDTGPQGRLWRGQAPPQPPRQTVRRKPQVLNHALERDIVVVLDWLGLIPGSGARRGARGGARGALDHATGGGGSTARGGRW